MSSDLAAWRDAVASLEGTLAMHRAEPQYCGGDGTLACHKQVERSLLVMGISSQNL